MTQGLSLVVWHLALGWLERVGSGWSVRAHREGGGVGALIVGLYLKGALSGELLAVAKNWLIWGEGPSSLPETPENIGNKKA